jgi:hypothetical protein
MTTVIERKAVFTHGNRRWHLVKGAVCQDVIEEATSKYYKERTKWYKISKLKTTTDPK